jgi:hypothetical protein
MQWVFISGDMRHHYPRHKSRHFIPEETKMKWDSNIPMITNKQLGLIDQLVIDIEDTGVDFDPQHECKSMFKKPINKLTVPEASEFIEFLIAERRYYELEIE